MSDKAKAVTAAVATPGTIVFNVVPRPEERDLFERGVVALEKCERHLAVLAAKFMNAGGKP